MGFLFAVLGSVTFWIVFGAMSIFIGSLMLKHMAPMFYSYIMTGHSDSYVVDPMTTSGVIILFFVLWPVTLACATIGFIIRRVIWPLFVRAIRASVSMVPDIEIKKKDNADT